MPGEAKPCRHNLDQDDDPYEVSVPEIAPTYLEINVTCKIVCDVSRIEGSKFGYQIRKYGKQVPKINMLALRYRATINQH